jgi:hypothetical protein
MWKEEIMSSEANNQFMEEPMKITKNSSVSRSAFTPKVPK